MTGEPIPPAAATAMAETPRTGGSRMSAALKLSMLVLVCETALLAAAYLLNWPPLLWLMAHIALVAAFAIWTWRRRSDSGDLSASALVLLAAFVAGPIGAALAAVAVLRLEAGRSAPGLLAAWYERIALSGDIDPVTRLADTVAMGRAVRTPPDVPRSFVSVMADGTLADRQTALGLIARQFSPAYAPALRAALVIGEPVIRVQAAAVAVKVRAELKASLRTELAAAAALDGCRARECARASQRIGEMLGSEMLDDDDKQAAQTAVTRLNDLAAANGAALDATEREHLETALVRAGKFAEFRALRQAGSPDA